MDNQPFFDRVGKALTKGNRPIWILLAYIVSPIDALPEIALGPIGFVDDAAAFAMLGAFVIHRLRKRRLGTATGGETKVSWGAPESDDPPTGTRVVNGTSSVQDDQPRS